MERNPSAPSHLTMAQAGRLLNLKQGSIRNRIQTGKLTVETHYGTKMVPMWSILELQGNPDDLG